MKYALPVLVLLLSACASGSHPNVHTGRSLDEAEVQALREGRGMGQARVAELTGYPGPMHVLELKDELELTPDQRFASSRLMGEVRAQARALGERIIEEERRLERDLAAGSLSAADVEARIQAIGALRAQLRFVHVRAHLAQHDILTPEQRRRYRELRGIRLPGVPAGVIESHAKPPPNEHVH